MKYYHTRFINWICHSCKVGTNHKTSKHGSGMGELEMSVKKWEDVVGKPFTAVERVTREMVEAATQQTLVIRGSVRLMTGRLSTTDDLEARRRYSDELLSE